MSFLNKSRHLITFLSKFHQPPLCTSFYCTATHIQTPTSSSGNDIKSIDESFKQLDTTFEDTREAFKSKSNLELLRGIFVLRLCTIDWIVQNHGLILASFKKIFGLKILKKFLKLSFYGQFVAGETTDEVLPRVQKMRSYGVKSILDYSVESDISQEQAEQSAFEGIVSGDLRNEVLSKVVGPEVVQKAVKQYSVNKEFADRRKDVISARTYFYMNEAACERNCDIFCETIDTIAEVTGGEGFIGIKLTALGRPQILLKLSETLAHTHNFFRAITESTWENLLTTRINRAQLLLRLKKYNIELNTTTEEKGAKEFDDAYMDYYNWTKLIEEPENFSRLFQMYNPDSQEMEPLFVNVPKDDITKIANMMDRLVRVCEYAISKGVRVMIDAEQSYFQPAISRLTLSLMRKYNIERGWIFNTYQAYLKNCVRDMELDMLVARRENFHFGCKLVRGAYMEQERKRANDLGYDDPINPNSEETSAMYDRALKRIVEEHESRGPGWSSVMIASHNEDSIRSAIQLMKEKNLKPAQRIICFAQLYGMCDQVTYSLGQAGFSVYKYVPYGPVQDVLPYLSRRAQENSSLVKKSSRDRKLLSKELKRRIFSGEFTH